MNITTQMTDLKLLGMAKSWSTLEQSGQLNQLDLPDGLALLLQAEKENRVSRRTVRLIQQARFRYQASFEEITFSKDRQLDKSLVLSLADGQYIEKGKSVVITGPTGVGKSFIASALGHQACLLGHTTLYTNIQKLMTRLRLARIDGTIFKLQKTLYRKDVLILDDFGIQSFNEKQRIDFFEMLEERHGRKTMIYISQIPVSDWFDIIGDNTIADAVVDRVIHQSIKIDIQGQSMRMVKSVE